VFHLHPSHFTFHHPTKITRHDPHTVQSEHAFTRILTYYSKHSSPPTVTGLGILQHALFPSQGVTGLAYYSKHSSLPKELPVWHIRARTLPFPRSYRFGILQHAPFPSHGVTGLAYYSTHSSSPMVLQVLAYYSMLSPV
jgi:hypothetical protein